MKKNEKTITGTDIAYYCSIIMLVGSIIGIILEFVNKTYDFKYWILFILLGIGSYTSNKDKREDKNK